MSFASQNLMQEAFDDFKKTYQLARRRHPPAAGAWRATPPSSTVDAVPYAFRRAVVRFNPANRPLVAKPEQAWSPMLF
jgi:hypothetical protein